MNSPNIKHYPLNRAGALEMGLSPCSVCNTGFANYCGTKSHSCHDTCDYFKTYFDEEKMEQIKLKEIDNV